MIDRRAMIGLLVATASTPAVGQTAVDGARLARTVADLVRREYPDVEAAERLASVIRAHARAGRYRGLSAQALSQRLTADLRANIPDEHLNVSYNPQSAAHRTPVDAVPEASPPTPRTLSPLAQEIFGAQAYGIASVRRLPGNIGVLEVDNFPPLYDIVKQRYAEAMNLLSDTYGLVIDLRNNGGGSSDSPPHLISYLFDREPFLLNRVENRRLPPDEAYTTRELLGANYGESRPVAVAISSQTFSAAEAVAFDLKVLGRATIVGERSRGGANPGDFFNVGQGFEAFVPQGRASGPNDSGNWEGVGVTPDIASTAADALRIAHRAVAEAALAQNTNVERGEVLRQALTAP